VIRTAGPAPLSDDEHGRVRRVRSFGDDLDADPAALLMDSQRLAASAMDEREQSLVHRARARRPFSGSGRLELAIRECEDDVAWFAFASRASATDDRDEPEQR
jgi:hypothetical protein